MKKHRKDTYAVVTGGRRLAALQLLAKNGTLPADHPVKCELLGDQANALELSLAENAVREQMHPADEFDAFRALIDDGMPTTDIAARFGVTENVVLQRLKLARVSPVVIRAYRDGEIDLECVMAFAAVDDHKRQEHFWKTAPAWAKEQPRQIRDALTEGEIDAADRRVRFVTLLAYERAGGTTRRDLFADGEHGIFIGNVELLNKLVADKLHEATESLLKESWKWVEFLPERGYEIRAKLQRLPRTEGPLPEKLQSEYDKISAELKKLEAKKNPSDADHDRASEIEDRIHDLDYERPELFKPEQVAMAGVFLEIEQEGTLDIQRGYVRPEDVRAIKSVGPDAGDAKPKPAEKAGLSQPALRDLGAHRTAAIAALLMDNPKIALASVVHSIGVGCLYKDRFGRSIAIDITGPNWPVDFRQPGNSRAIDGIEKARKEWRKRLPAKQKDFWQWCIDADQKTLSRCWPSSRRSATTSAMNFPPFSAST